MVNIEDFIKRLEIILDYYGLNASAFADKIGVQRSSLSHLLSGRNKPSLDFILKILDVFPDVDLYWILNGKGSFPKNMDAVSKKESTPPLPIVENTDRSEDLFTEREKEDLNPKVERKLIEEQIVTKNPSEGEIDKIVVFYKNGTFKSYFPE